MDKFDKFIKKHTEKELELPVELKWQKMNIQLPTNKKRKNRKVIFLLIALVTIISFAYFYFCNNNANPSLTKSSSEDLTVVSQSTYFNFNSLATDSLGVPEIHQSDFNSQKGDDKSIKEEDSGRNERPTIEGSNASTYEKVNSESTPPNVVKVEQPSQSIFSQPKISDVLSTRIQQNRAHNNPIKEFRILGKITELQNLSNNNNSLDFVESLPVLEFDQKIEPINFKKSRLFSLYASIGYLNGKNDYSKGPQASILSSSESAGHGISTHFGAKLVMPNGMFILSELSYQRMNYLIMYSEELDKRFDSILFRQVTTFRHICHNNSIETSGIKLGIGKHFKLGKCWGSTLSMAFSSDYQLKATGRTLNDELSIIHLNNHQPFQKISHNAHIKGGLYYQYRDLRFTGNIGWQYGINSVQFFESSSLEYSPRIYRLALGIEKNF